MFMNEIDKQIQEELNKCYEDRNVTGIYKNKRLNIMINRRWNSLKISKKEYLSKLGFEYSTDDWGEKVNEENIESYLNKLYPEKIISSLGDIHSKKQKVYGFINDYCIRKGISNISYLNELGFSIQCNYISNTDISINKDANLNNDFSIDWNVNINDDISISKSFLYNPFAQRNKYNLVVLNKLKNSFNVKIAEIADMLNVSRQLIDQQIKRKNVDSTFNEEEEDFEDEVEEIIIGMINDFDVEYESEKIRVKFLWGKEKRSIVVLYTFHGDYKCVFNPDGIIGDLLNEKGYYKLGKYDIELFKKIKYCNGIKQYKRWNSDKEKYRIENAEIKKIINKNRKKYKMSEEEYNNFIGFEYYTYNEEIEDRLFNVFQKYLDDEGIVKIPIRLSNGKQNYEYIKANRDLETLGISKEEIIERFGFKYTKKRKRYIGDINEKYKKIIASRYIVQDNKVYINSQDKFYNNLNSMALRKNTTINDYIKDLGFIRLSKDELSSDYIEYDWRNNNKDNSEIIISKAKALLHEISNENNEVYLDTNNYEYNTLWKYAYLINMKLNDLIKKCNYIRSYNRNTIRSVDEKNKIKYNIDDIEKNTREEILEEIKNLEVVSEKQNTSITRATRNKKLPQLLKKLYLHKCQLCSQKEGSNPVIETINGIEYVEVHHITQLSEGFNINDESDNDLDYYKNCIVVCCYHHKFLHLHHGGFKKLIIVNGKLCFQSEKGDIIEVVTNYHLEPLE